MSLSPEDIKKVANLARLNVQEQQIVQLKTDLDNILVLVKKMNEVEVSGVESMAHSLDIVQPLREDGVTETNQRELFLKNAPQSYMGLFLVPQVIENSEEAE